MSEYLRYIEHSVKLIREGRAGEAEDILSQLIGHWPEDAFAIYILASLYIDTHRAGAAIPMLERAVALRPDLSEAWHNLGVAYKIHEDSENARRCYAERLRLEPNNADTLAMMAGTHVNAGSPGMGVSLARKALKIDPDNAHARNALALCLLEQREEEGWKHYARRWETPEMAPSRRDFGHIPRWEDAEAHPRRLVVHGEQGLGDEILFLSCLNEVGIADRVIIECAPRLVPLIRRSFDAEVYGTHDEVMEKADPEAWFPMGDLPGIYAPRREPYLVADPRRVAYWRDRLAMTGEGPYIACAWGGGSAKTHRSQRETSIHDWRPLLDQGGTWVSVHYKPEAADEAFTAGIHHWPEAIGDLDEMAALISACDLTVTVCQTAAHLSGALGRPTWIMTPKACAWRYLYNCTETRMNWYADAHLYRQSVAGRWDDVIERVRTDLAAYLGRLQGTESAAA